MLLFMKCLQYLYTMQNTYKMYLMTSDYLSHFYAATMWNTYILMTTCDHGHTLGVWDYS